MRSNYDEALRRLLISEGGYTNHPADPGGPTNFGITISDFRQYIKPDATAADVRDMTVDQAKKIYRARYWDAQRCDELPSGVDYAIFDYGVNSGIGRSGKVLRRCLNLSDATSQVTDGVIAATAATNVPALIVAICDERLRFLKSLRTWPVFGGGWGKRVAEVKLAALAMSQKQEPIGATQSTGKGIVPVNDAAQKGSASGMVASGAVASHASGYDPIWIGLIAIVIVISIIGLWAYFAHRQKIQQEAAA